MTLPMERNNFDVTSEVITHDNLGSSSSSDILSRDDDETAIAVKVPVWAWIALCVAIFCMSTGDGRHKLII